MKRKRSGIYVHGSERYFQWLVIARDHSRKGGESLKKKIAARPPAGGPLALALAPVRDGPLKEAVPLEEKNFSSLKKETFLEEIRKKSIAELDKKLNK